MALVNLTTLFGGVNPLNNSYSTPVNFKAGENIGAFNYKLNGYQDEYVTNTLGIEYKNPAKIVQYAKSSTRIMLRLKEKNLPLRVNIDAFDVIDNHLKTTRTLVAKMYSALPDALKSQIDGKALQEAAQLHDYGKILIPKEILNKKGALTPEEREIMELHSEFGYELLKQQGINEKVLKLVKYHHQKSDGSGYPPVDDGYECNLSNQILMAADKYSALTEDRCYHKAYNKEEALDIIYQDVKDGAISQEVFDALKKIAD